MKSRMWLIASAVSFIMSCAATAELPVRNSSSADTVNLSAKTDDFNRATVHSVQEKKNFKFVFKDSQNSVKPLRSSVAGPGNTGGGGDVVKCDGRYYFADTYDLFRSGLIKQSGNLPERVYMDAIRAELNRSLLGLGEVVQERISLLKFIDSNGPLHDLADDQISLEQLGCEEKNQLAIQDLATGVVRVDFKLLKGLTFQEIYYFKVHEALISLKKKHNDTTLIREELKNAIQTISLHKVIERVMYSYVEIPTSSKILWALKVVQALESQLNIRNDCAKENQENNEDCLLRLLLKKVSKFDGDGGEAQVAFISRFMLGAGFWGCSPDKLRSIVASNFNSVLGLSIAVSACAGDEVKFVKISEVDLQKYLHIHKAIIRTLSNSRQDSRSGNTEEVIFILEKAMEIFEDAVRNKS